MSKELQSFTSLEVLRREAEKKMSLLGNTILPSTDVNDLVHDLHLYQVELEMQNEELQRSNIEAESYALKYKHLFEFAPIGLLIIDKVGIIKSMNNAAREIVAIEKKKESGRRIQAYIQPSNTDSFYFFMQQILSNEAKMTLEVRINKNNDSPAYVLLEGIKLSKLNAEPEEILLAVVDLTERKNAAEALLKAHKNLETKVKERTSDLENANDALVAAKEEIQLQAKMLLDLNTELLESEQKLKVLNESKDKFFAILAHDLRSPLVGLIGYSKLMMSKIDVMSKDDIRKYLSNMHNYAENLEKLLNDLLSWSNLQLGHFSYNPAELDVTQIIKETIDIFSVSASEKDIDISWKCESACTLSADEKMVKSIFRNLLSNAIKFTRKGGEIYIKSEEEDRFLLFKIKDNGKGISERIKGRIFKIDEKSIAVGTANETGNGLGLILCKEFVEKHGGQIWFESEEGKGTEFFFRLPKGESNRQ